MTDLPSRRWNCARRALRAAVEPLERRALLSGNGSALIPYEAREPLLPGDPNFPAAYQLQQRWTSTASGPAGAIGTGITLTWSIVPDGTMLTTGVGEPNTASDLQAHLDALYGDEATWMPIIQQTFNEWSAISGITFVETTDDGAAYSDFNANGALGVRGDIRIGGHAIDGAMGTLGYAWFPDFGDVVLDSSDLGPGGYMSDTADNSLKLRNVLAHELGHALALDHVDPVDQTKLMEAFTTTAFDGPQFDDMAAINTYYGDIDEKGAGDNTATTAADLGTLPDGTDALTNLSLSTTADVDYYKFTIDTEKVLSITVSPFGPIYLHGPLGGPVTTFNGSAQIDLQAQLIASDGVTVLAISNGAGLGGSEGFDFPDEPAGAYYIRVSAVSGAEQTAQMYNLTTIAAEVRKTTVALDDNQNLIVTDSTPGGKNDQLTFIADTDNNQFVISDPTGVMESSIATATGAGTPQLIVPFSAVTGTGISINTLSGDDTISITGGAMPITVDAGDGTDAINIIESDPLVPVIIASSGGDDAVNVNSDNAGAAAVIFPVSQTIGALNIGSGGVASLPAVAADAPPEVLVTTSVTIAGSLDLANNDLVVDYTDASPIGTWNGSAYDGITGLIQSGRNGGGWMGSGIVTRMTDAGGDHPITTLAVAEASTALAISDAQTALFDGRIVDATTVLVKYTYIGDMNLDDTINGDDYFAIDNGLAAQTTGYANGDLDCNGRIDADDYFLIDSNYANASAPPASAPPFSSSLSRSLSSPLSPSLSPPLSLSPSLTPSEKNVFAGSTMTSAYQRLIAPDSGLN